MRGKILTVRAARESKNQRKRHLRHSLTVITDTVPSRPPKTTPPPKTTAPKIPLIPNVFTLVRIEAADLKRQQEREAAHATYLASLIQSPPLEVEIPLPPMSQRAPMATRILNS